MIIRYLDSCGKGDLVGYVKDLGAGRGRRRPLVSHPLP